MSRRTITVLIVLFAGLIIANVLVLAIWLPNRKAAVKPVTTSDLAPAVPGSNANQPAAVVSSPAAPTHPAQPTSGFAIERQVLSPSGNVRINYLRDRSTKTHRISVEDAHRPTGNAVLYETKRSAWALVSPDDQWIMVADRGATGAGAIELFHRTNSAPIHFAPAPATDGARLQDAVWKAYLSATEADPNTPQTGATINANAWETDSRKLDLSVAYLAGPKNPDVPAPWSCTYDVSSKQVETVSSPNDDQAEKPANSEQQNTDAEAVNPLADNSNGSPSEQSADTEFAGEKFPATRLDELTAADVNESSLDEINYAINEMFARHGAEFKDKKVSEKFSDFSWYQPRAGVTTAQAEMDFSNLEKENLKVLQRCRDAKIAIARRRTHSDRGSRVEEESTGTKILRGLRTWQEMGGPLPPHP
jgi:hypothetical protein